jgi:uncharacterized protein
MMGVKVAALFLLICSPALADISACREAFNKDLYAAAIKECSPLAKAGSPEAQLNVGFMHRRGKEGVPQDFKEAARWLKLAAEQGHAYAQDNLGGMYSLGQGVPQDYKEAVRWYRLAAEQGHAYSQQSLGGAYDIGQGVPQDYAQAHKWLNLAASRASAADLKQSAEARDAVAKLMTPTQIEAAQKLGHEWLAAFEKRGRK